MTAQISNERAGQAIDIYMAIADSKSLSKIDALLQKSGFPESQSGLSELSPENKRKLHWQLMAQQVQIENVL